MASYRLSASLVKRSAGRSATAAAAYRAAERIQDDRYDELHDYTRKQGVEHAEILAPEDAPDWMLDREKLWNAVEAVERRKDAQLAREIQLSLPHELNADERRELVRMFVQEQFVARGMIADLAVHAPHRDGDQRNHHAHVMLTLRELTGEGFGKKNRDWNDPKNLEQWREAWAHAQNREFERLGLDVRVDHRSFEDQGIDREPQQHEGPAATGKRRRGEPTRIGDENDRRQAANDNRADLHTDALRIQAHVERQRDRFEQWAAEKAAELESAQLHSRIERERAQGVQMTELEDQLTAQYGEHLATVKADLDATRRRLDVGGVRGAWRFITGGTARDRKRQEEMQLTIHDTEQRMAEMRAKLEKAQEAERARLDEHQAERQAQQQEGIERARERKEEALRSQAQEWWRELPEPSQDGATRSWWEKDQPEQEKAPEQPPKSQDKDRGHEPQR